MPLVCGTVRCHNDSNIFQFLFDRIKKVKWTVSAN